MIALPLALALLLAAPGTPARNRPRPADAASAEEPLSDAEVAGRVETYLGTIDTPVPAARWRALGARAVAPLSAVATGDAFPSRRARALGALAALGGERARETILAAARSEQQPFAVRASALRGAGQVLAPRELASALRPVLEKARDRGVRAVAAEVLARDAPDAACGAVRAQAAREREHAAAFEGAVARCRAAAK